MIDSATSRKSGSKSHRIQPHLAATLVMMLGVCCPYSSSAMESTSSAMTSAELGELLKDSSVKVSARTTTVVGTGPAVTVLAEEDAKASEQDLKIDAIFLSKVLIEATNGQIQSVKVLFSQIGKEGRFISITRNEIVDYGKGKITARQLLASLRINSVEPERAPDVAQGPLFERRLLLWQKLNKLRQQGTGTKPFEMIFAEIEGLAKTGDMEKLVTRLAYLENKIAEQQEQIESIRKAARGLGVPAVASRNESSAPSGQGERQGIARNALTGSDPLSTLFKTRAEQIIKQVADRNPSEGDQLKVLKSQVDDALRNNDSVLALGLIHEFRMRAKQAIGSDPFPSAPMPPAGGPMQGGPIQGGPRQEGPRQDGASLSGGAWGQGGNSRGSGQGGFGGGQQTGHGPGGFQGGGQQGGLQGGPGPGGFQGGGAPGPGGFQGGP